jgi:ATP-binding protein involved in chromosome partitioning
LSSNLQQRISTALRTVRNNRVNADVEAAGMVADVATTTEGRVRLSLYLSAEDDAVLAREVRQAVERVEGVRDVLVDVKDAGARVAAGAETARQEEPRPQRRSLNVLEPERPAAPRPQAPRPQHDAALGSIIAVSSGKGGVGKSTVTTNVAAALALAGHRVGLMDADIYGPNVPRMMGVNSPPPVENQKIIPLEAHGVKIMSLGFLVERDQPAIWRGPIVMKIITQFLRDVQWGQLDFLVVDMPPGTGDAQLSLVQATMVSGAVIVTTPQDVATGDALRGARMFERVGVPVLGIIENMSWFECRHCGEREYLFGEGGGARLALELSLPLLGEVPLYPPVLAAGENGVPIVIAEPDSTAAKVFSDIAVQVAARGVKPAN